MSTTTALRLSAVWACVSLLSDTISTLPLGFYEKTTNGRKPASDHPPARVLSRQPNTQMTAANFLGATIAAMLLRGVAYWEKQLSAGRPIGLGFLPNDCSAITCLPDGRKTYRFTEYGKTREIPEDRIVKIIGFSLNGRMGSLCGELCVQRVPARPPQRETAAANTFLKGLLQTVFSVPDGSERVAAE